MSIRRSLTCASRRGEDGVSLVEMMISLLVLSIVMGLFGPTIVSSLSSAGRVESQSRALDQLRLSMQAIARELRSADCVNLPAISTGQTQSSPGSTLDFTTFANNASPAYRVAYAAAGGKLTRTTYDVDGNATGSRTVAEWLVNPSGAFTQVATPRRSVQMTFNVQVDTRQSARALSTTVAGRNAWKDSQC